MDEGKLNEIVTLAGKRAFFFQTAEVYPDMNSGFIEYGPLGTKLKNKIIDSWRRFLVKRDEMIEIDGSQIMPKSIFVASGHLSSFSDPLVQCEKCKMIARADKLIEEKTHETTPEKLKMEDYDFLIEKNKIQCPKCKGALGKTRPWNMMFKVGIGPEQKESYLRPETCQSIFADFPRLYATARIKLPIGIGQVGKSFRNEISPRQSLLRMREFTQAEIEVFFNPEKTELNASDVEREKYDSVKSYVLMLLPNGKKKAEEISVKDAVSKKIISSPLIAYHLSLLQQFYEKLGVKKKSMRFRQLNDQEKAFYAKDAWDFEVETSIGWVELVACNNRSDYDLSSHQRESKKNFYIMDEDKKVLPHVFELSMGIDRTLYILMEYAFEKEKVKEEERSVLHFAPLIAPYQVAIFPLVNKDGLPEVARKIYNDLKDEFECSYDASGSIGKMYRRQDEIGTKMSITVDYDTKKDKTVSIRDRDTMKQIRVKVSDLSKIIQKVISGEDLLKLGKPIK